MSIDWSIQLAKKAALGKQTPSIRELEALEVAAANILGVDLSAKNRLWAKSLGYGMRTKTLISPLPNFSHQFSSNSEQIVIKLFRGPAKELVEFHANQFANLPVLPKNAKFQQSIEAGVSECGQSYAILSYVSGQPLVSRLQNEAKWEFNEAASTISDLFRSIWIPVWEAGLRFKDCHSGNFIIRSSDKRIVMIDCEQMRKSAAEARLSPNIWNQRNQHENSAIRRLPNLLTSFMSAGSQSLPHAKLKRIAVGAIKQAGLTESLHALGRANATAEGDAHAAVEQCISILQEGLTDLKTKQLK